MGTIQFPSRGRSAQNKFQFLAKHGFVIASERTVRPKKPSDETPSLARQWGFWPRIPDRRFSPLDLPNKTHSGFNGCLSIKAGLRNAIF